MSTTDGTIEKYMSKYTPSALKEKLKPSNVRIDVARYEFSRKHYQDWQGNWHKQPPKAPINAANSKIKKIRFDTWSDTRSSWYNA